MRSNRRTHIPASTQPAMLCLLSLVTEPFVRRVKACVCVIRSIPLFPPSLITQIEMQIRKQSMFICLCSAARHTAHTSVSFKKTALTHSVLPNPMCLNQLTICAPLQNVPGLILNYMVYQEKVVLCYILDLSGWYIFLSDLILESLWGSTLTLTVLSTLMCSSKRLTQASNEKAMWAADWEPLMFVLPVTIIWSYVEWPHTAGTTVMLIKLFLIWIRLTLEKGSGPQDPQKTTTLHRALAQSFKFKH